MHTMRRGVTAALLILAAGCGGRSDGPKTYPVKGKVTYKGAPVADATISLHPVGSQRSAHARSNAAGEFQVSTIGEHDGAMEGDYRVTVSKIVNEAAAPPSNDIAAPAPPPQFKSHLPEKYGKPETSGLTATVKKTGTEPLTLDLKDE